MEPNVSSGAASTGGRTVEVVGLVGCGRMGTAIGRHLLRAGWPVAATDVDPAARRRLAAEGAMERGTAREVAETSDLVLLVVVDDEQVATALSRENGVLGGARPGTVVAISASVRPDNCRELAREAATRDVHVVDVALVRGERGAEAGELLLLCGGPEQVLSGCQQAFSAFATDVYRVGDVGAGQVGKVVNNILLWSCIRADVEAQRLGRALGVEPGVLRPAMALGSGANRPLAEWGKHRLRWPTKDLEVALALAEEVGVDVPYVRALAPLMQELTVTDLEELL